MNLDSYLNRIDAEPAVLLAKRLNVPPALLSQWRTGVRPVPADRCPSIERETSGLVRCEDLRPDVDWAYLRNTDCQKAA